MKYSKYIIASFLGVAAASAACQDPFFFKSLNLDNGLSQNTVNTVCQDQYGFMWFGTNDGLNKYDGYDFTVYRSDPSDKYALRSDAISCMLLDSEQNLWIGTRGGGLNRYDHVMDRFVYYDLNLTFNVIRCLFEDSEGSFWVGTNSGLCLLDRETGTYLRFDHNISDPFSLSNSIVSAIAEDPSGNIWIGTREGGVDLFNRQSGVFTHFGPRSGNVDAIPFEWISDLYADPSGSLWVASEREGLARYNIPEGRTETYPILLERFDPSGLSHFHIMDLYSKNGKEIWIATLGGGISLLDTRTGIFNHFFHSGDDEGTIGKNSVNSIFIDCWENLWIGTEGAGINLHDSHRKEFYTYRSGGPEARSLSANSVLSIAEADPGYFWIGTDEGGLNLFDSHRQAFTHHYLIHPDIPGGQSTNVVTSLLLDRDGQFWIGTFGGLYLRAGNSYIAFHHNPGDPLSLSSNDVFSLLEDSGGRFWVGTNGGGLNLFDRSSRRTRRFMSLEGDNRSLSNNYVTDILEDSQGNLWIGTWEGLNRMDPAGGGFTRFFHHTADTSTISSNEITAMLEDSQGRLWIGTFGGLNLYDPVSVSFRHFTEKQGLSNNVICGILEDDKGMLWISTFKGMVRFNPESQETRNFYVSDGLQGNQFNIMACAKGRSGEMLFGGINGLNYFHPDSIHINPVPPPVILTGFRLYNRKMKPGVGDTPLERSIWETKELRLGHFQSTFSFEFVALNFASSEYCNYRYKLENFDLDWVENGPGRNANYTNVPPGSYTFRVIASNNDGIWNSEGISLPVTIEPPYWATWWFRSAVILLVIGMISALHYLRVYNIQHQKKILEVEVKSRTREVIAQKKEIEAQASEISRMNTLLQSRNIDLTKDVKEKSLALVMQKRVSFEDFREIYPDDETCLDFIRKLKSEIPFDCARCHHHEFYEMTGHHFRRCKKCGYRESVTVNTIFHRLKFPVVKAFYILYLVSMGRELTVDELSRLISLRRETCWSFRNRVMEVMSTRKRFRNPREGWKELILMPGRARKVIESP
jgi:ligand-binding sensor domain-containing protein